MDQADTAQLAAVGGALGSAVVPSDEALAQVALEVSRRPLVVSNVDLSAAHVGGLESDLVAQFLHELANGADLTLHLRLLHGEDTEHVLSAIFKALGVALAQATRPKPAKRPRQAKRKG
jgi:imidazoleglycerol-phosphate dehydratase